MSAQETNVARKVTPTDKREVKELKQGIKTMMKKKPDKKVIEGAALIGIDVAKEDDFSGWYNQVLRKADMLEDYDVPGCYILKPWSYGIWERIQHYLDDKIKTIGVKNCYFPMFIPKKNLEHEKDHVEGFAPEVAWVTMAGNENLPEHVAVRPTSETAMYPAYQKWIRSHRDLPLRLNQWNSVVRWEFKQAQPFLRTREFLWQEGHTAHLTKDAAAEEVLQILDFYAAVYEELLAVPTIKGTKTEKEKFAGGLYTTTCEGYIPSNGRAIQGATSHCLGQNFSKMFQIEVEDPEKGDGSKTYVWQNSWGLSTRVIGVMVMIHSDNKGLVLPPRIAEYQVVIIPCGINVKTSAEIKGNVDKVIKQTAESLTELGVRVEIDDRSNVTVGWKFNDWELKGVPLRLEVGPKDLEKGQALLVRRDTGAKEAVSIDSIKEEVKNKLDSIQRDLHRKAKDSFDSHIIKITKWEDFVPALNALNIILMPFCEKEACEDSIKERSAKKAMGDEEIDPRLPSMGAKSLCIPFDQPEGPHAIGPDTKCVACGEPAKSWTLFGRSY